MIAKVSVACDINPQVMLVTLQKESGLLDRRQVSERPTRRRSAGTARTAARAARPTATRPTPASSSRPTAWPSSGRATWSTPASTATRPARPRWCCGTSAESAAAAPTVTINNKATASLYNYTPYQPNAAALASYPGTGDACSAYGNRNFFFLFGQYFGTTGGVSVEVKGVDVTIPYSPAVPGALVGAVVKAPNARWPRASPPGLAALGTPYVWGGGTAGGPADEGCSRGGGASNSCAGLVGFDCSGLTGYVLTSAGFSLGDNSGAQRGGGTSVAWSDGRPGDIVGWSGHVAIYLGAINGVEYVLEAPDVGRTVSIRAVYGSHDSDLHRYWS